MTINIKQRISILKQAITVLAAIAVLYMTMSVRWSIHFSVRLAALFLYDSLNMLANMIEHLLVNIFVNSMGVNIKDVLNMCTDKHTE